MAVPIVGDILMLSQVSWKIGRAFIAGQKSAPAEFQEIETRVSSLSKQLKQLAEALHAETDHSLIEDASEHIQHGVRVILDSCERTIKDLESLVDRNQVIKKHRTVGGFAIERSWSDLVLAEYATMTWTTEGGGLHCLMDVLQMHASSIKLLTQAINSKSHSRIESVVGPMADRIDGIWQSPCNIDEQLEEVHLMMETMILAIPTEQSPPIPDRHPARSPGTEAPNPINQNASSPPRQQRKMTLPASPQRTTSPNNPVPPTSPSSLTETIPHSRVSSPINKRVSEFSFGGSSLRYSSSSYASSTASSGGWSSPGTPLINQQYSTNAKITTHLPTTPEGREVRDHMGGGAISLLPPPALGYAAQLDVERPTSRPTVPADLGKLHRSSTTTSQKAAFEKEAFRNSAVLCDVRGKLAQYSHQINEDDPRDVEMIPVCEDCRIAVVRKRVHDPETRAVRVVTSIWVFSDDNTVRMELRMDDEQMYIPYSSYFSPTKVSITVPCELKFHDVKHGSRPAKLARTTWVNYVFQTRDAAALFQNELMGRTLLATFRTEKTMRIHEGIGKSFSYAEQMCGLENLRVWEDNDTGAIIALIHFSADFRDGYLAFYLNSSGNPIKVKDEGNREVKIKGLRVPLERGDKAMRKDSVVAGSGKDKGKGKEDAKKIEKEKVISGAKIEFATEMEKQEFVEMCKELQRDSIELPDLLGVN
ncbi:hypothetical protein HBH98_131200 [Parastagonospora nodorum]|nr:hypothetical protein HBH53_038110 [Parastagonospora nodorum]KAH3976182.1 hypothetical protein HBH52_120530 [Parastagonospora nodorum]KAH3984301.1 hypothetical protein HBH51_028250 [Parastagonospora nodorum]KAH4000458.1 hypothetical protein HBI10_101030 [Parastagonospora nodorum]KAH4026618.1 hypothetical protein HBI13_064570 [Parastagonospora nodorum]